MVRMNVVGKGIEMELKDVIFIVIGFILIVFNLLRKKDDKEERKHIRVRFQNTNQHVPYYNMYVVDFKCSFCNLICFYRSSNYYKCNYNGYCNGYCND